MGISELNDGLLGFDGIITEAVVLYDNIGTTFS